MTVIFFRRRSGIDSSAVRKSKRSTRGYRRGQAMVEFALIATIALIVLMAGIQFAIIGQAALAVSQASYVAARSATINTSVTNANISSIVSNQFSPTITAPANALTINMVTAGDATCVPNRTLGCQVTVTVTYNATSKLALPNPFLGISFPTTLTSSESMMTQ